MIKGVLSPFSAPGSFLGFEVLRDLSREIRTGFFYQLGSCVDLISPQRIRTSCFLA